VLTKFGYVIRIGIVMKTKRIRIGSISILSISILLY